MYIYKYIIIFIIFCVSLIRIKREHFFNTRKTFIRELCILRRCLKYIFDFVSQWNVYFFLLRTVMFFFCLSFNEIKRSTCYNSYNNIANAMPIKDLEMKKTIFSPVLIIVQMKNMIKTM